MKDVNTITKMNATPAMPNALKDYVFKV